MGKKDKAKKGEKKARKAAAIDKKTSKTSKKREKITDEDDDVDLDSLLADYHKEQERFLKITEEEGPPPSRRLNATLFHNPLKSSELFLFGGEYYNGNVCNFYNDLYVFNVDRGDWKRITSPNSPLPRSSHQAVVHPSNKVFLFGGLKSIAISV